jgi:hypothetical protein
MSDPARRVAELIVAADRSMKAMRRALLALETVAAQTEEIIAELRKAHDGLPAGSARPAKRRRRAKVGA